MYVVSIVRADDWRQERVRWEAEAILAILARIDSGQWQLVSSEAIEAELEKMSNLERLENIFKLLELATITVSLDQNIDQRSQELENLGEGLYDSFHIACAEVERVDVLLTTDDRLLKRATRYRDILQVTLNNPVTWLMDIFQEGGEQNHDTN
jgi:predicted nucleic acid-binding protein